MLTRLVNDDDVVNDVNVINNVNVNSNHVIHVYVNDVNDVSNVNTVTDEKRLLINQFRNI